MARRIHPFVVSGVLALSGVVAALNGTLVIPLIPVFPSVLGVTTEQAMWLITITMLCGAVAIPTATRLADMYGRRNVLINCLAAMGLGSLLSAVAWDFSLMLVGRAMAGLGLPLMPIAIAILRDAMPRERVGTAVATMSATAAIGSAVGMPLAGILFGAWGWRSVFVVIAVAAFALAAAVMAIVPATRAGSGGRFDSVGALLLAVATGSLILLISEGSNWGWSSAVSIVLAIAATVAFVVWILVELRTPDPLIDLRKSASLPVLLTNVVALFVGLVLLVYVLMAMQQLQAPVETGYGLGLGMLEATLYMLPSSLVLVVVAPIAGYALNRFGGKPVLLSGLVLMTVGYVCRLYFHSDALQILLVAMIVSLGSGLAFSAMPMIIMRSVPDRMAAAANGLNALIRQFGMAGSSAIVAGVIAANAVFVGGLNYPAWVGMAGLDLFAVVTCALGACVALALPRRV